MKWYEFSDDCGDGTTMRRRFRTKEEAQKARDWLKENDESFLLDGDGSPVIEIDTDSKYFFSSLEEISGESNN